MSVVEKSDSPKVARKQANKAATAAAELVERRGGAKEKAELQSTDRTQSREAVSQAQARIREAVTRNGQDKLTALLHHIGVDALRASFSGLKKSAAPGVDDVTWTEYAENLEANLADLHRRVHTGAYRALPSRRKYIPKVAGRQRPLGIAALEDKVVQAAVVATLTPIYEAEFLGFSYGFRPGRNQHQALDALAFGIGKTADQLGPRCRYPGVLRHGQPGPADPYCRAPHRRSPGRKTDPQVVGSRGSRRRPADRDGAGDASGRCHQPAFGEHLPPLRLRSVGPPVAAAMRHRRDDRRALCGRHHRRLRAWA